MFGNSLEHDDNRILRLDPIEDGGYSIVWKYQTRASVQYVYPDGDGWRPWSMYGQVMNAGYPPYRTPILAAYNEQCR